MIIGSFISKLGVSEKSIRVWSVENGELIEVIPLETFRGYKYPIAISHDGDLVAISFYSRKVGCYSLKKQKWLWKVDWLKEERWAPQELKFTFDNRNIIVIGERHTVIYNIETGNTDEIQFNPLKGYILFKEFSTGVKLSPSGQYLVAWQREPLFHEKLIKLFMNKKVTVWDIKENKLVAQWKKPKKNLCSAAFTPDERYILFGSLGGYISVWSISEKKVVKEWKALKTGIDYLIISPNGKMIAIFTSFGSSYDNVQIWDYEEKKLLYKSSNVGLKIGGYPYCQLTYPMAFSPDSKYFALEKNGYLCLYETSTWKEKWCVPSYSEE